jgi:hypothetical protein
MNAKAITRQSCRRLLQVSGVATAALMLEGLPLTARAENAGKSSSLQLTVVMLVNNQA